MNEMDILHQIIKTAQESLEDAEKVIKKNKTAGVRLRKQMQTIRTLAKQIRDSVQEKKQ